MTEIISGEAEIDFQFLSKMEDACKALPWLKM